jgi:succinoglycan biosynthesis transport protein ExoP
LSRNQAAQAFPEKVEQADAETNLMDYFYLALKHQRSILWFVGLAVLLTMLVVFEMTPVYRSVASIEITAEKPKPLTTADLYNDSVHLGDDYIRTQMEILKSRVLAEKVISKLELDKHPAMESGEFTLASLKFWKSWFPAPTEEDLHGALVKRFSDALTIEQVRNSQVVKISFESPNRELAANVPNALAELYIENDLETKVQMMQKANGWLTRRMGGMRSNLEASEAALQNYREQKNIVDTKGVALNGASAQLDKISTNVITSRQQLSEAQNAYNQVKNLKGQPPSAFESIPAVLKSLLYQQTKAAEVRAENNVASLKDRYGSQHPKMVAAQAELAESKDSLARQVQSIVAGIEKEYEVAKENNRSAESTQSQVKSEIQNVNRKEFQLSVLQRDVDSNRQLYDQFMSRAKENNVGANLETTVAHIIDPAIPTKNPVKPQKGLIFGVVLVLGPVLGMMLAFLLEILDSTIKNAFEVESKLGMPMLGVVQILEPKKKRAKGVTSYDAAMSFLKDSHSSFSESFRTIRTGVLLSAIDQPHKIIMVTSSLPQEGKTTVAINLASALAQMKRVLMVDADLRMPTVGKSFGEDPGKPGLLDVLVGTSTLAQAIHSTPSPNLFVLPSGKLLTNPLELVSSVRFEEALATLKGQFDMIVLDCPPVMLVSDSLVLSRQVDAVVYVIRADQTTRQQALSGLKRLQDVNAPLLGVVLNLVDLEKVERYSKYKGGYYSYGYGKYSKQGYGYGKNPAAPPSAAATP